VTAIKFDQLYSTDPTVTSYFGNLNTNNNHGALMHAEVVNEVQIQMLKATAESNTAKNHGGLFSFDNVGKYTLTIDQCTITGNSATFGSGGLVYSSSTTSDTKVYISRTTTLNNNAKTDGGLVYLGGANVNWLTIDSSKLQTQMSS